MNEIRRGKLQDFKVPQKLKLSALWTSVMFLYVYGDYFNMYMPGKIDAMSKGDLGIGAATGTLMLGVSLMMAIPSLMIFLSLALPPWPNRLVNILFGLAYSVILALTMPGAEPFYIFYAVLEIVLTLLVVWFALVWPKQSSTA